ncbi:unnamed protein product [marine sediment metagenome]|uniref:Uncharacterized protein n=1 Tax=marine sediment metagenome TaxID=412755 RepID=X1CZ46_9ZZZZ
MLKNINPDNEGIAIIGAVVIVIVSVFVLGVEAKNIALAIGSGLVGYISRSLSKE